MLLLNVKKVGYQVGLDKRIDADDRMWKFKNFKTSKNWNKKFKSFKKLLNLKKNQIISKNGKKT